MDTSKVILDTWDVGFFIITLVVSVLIGLYFATKNKNLEEYMVGGRSQSLFPVSVSMMTSFCSGITIIGYSSEYYNHGISYALVSFGYLLGTPISAFILLPVFHRLEGISIFSYLEFRYNAWCKRIISIIFMVQMTLYSAVVLYVPSLSLKSVLGISDIVSIGVVGAVCLAYCTIGGIKAVIWTDFFQAGLMYLSLLSICIFGTIEAGGFFKLIEINQSGGLLAASEYLNFDLTSRHTIYTTIFGSNLIYIFMSGANQVQVQRCLTLPKLKQAQWSLFISSIFVILITSLSSYIGMILFATYKDCDPFENHQIDKREASVIYYVATHLNYLIGLRGIFVAGIFAATLSTISSFANSMAALTLEDFIKPAFANANLTLSEKVQTWLGKSISFFFGLACIGLTSLVGRVSGLLQVTLTLFGVLGAPFIAAFLLGMLTRFINSSGIIVGLITGFIFGLYIQFYQYFYIPPLEPSMPISTVSCPTLTTNLIRNSSSLLTLQIEERLSAKYSFSELYGFVYISYLWVPVLSFLLTSSVATAVSLLTGNSKVVDERYLVSWMHTAHHKEQFEMYKSKAEPKKLAQCNSI